MTTNAAVGATAKKRSRFDKVAKVVNTSVTSRSESFRRSSLSTASCSVLRSASLEDSDLASIAVFRLPKRARMFCGVV